MRLLATKRFEKDLCALGTHGCALGTHGAEFVVSMFEQHLTSVMHQLGCERLQELRDREPRLAPA